MSNHKLLSLWGLKELLESNTDKLYSPEGTELTVVTNGLLGGQLLYDHENKKVYGLCLKEVKNPGKDYLDQCAGQFAQEQVKWNMSYDEAINFLKRKGKWD